MPRVLTYLFETLTAKQFADNFSYTVKCSYLEVYMERVCDLLEDGLPQREVRELGKKYFVQDLKEVVCETEEDAMRLLTLGSQR